MLKNVSLDDKYDLSQDSAYLTGIEALVRLPLIQHQFDLDAGLNTAGFISGYRGSPVGTLDMSLHQARHQLEAHQIRFQPGVNEDLAATAVWGTQQVGFLPGPRYDGVFAMWYGKGPGVDRSMDVIKHANAFGTSRYGGVLAVAGDDHACKSSTVPHQSEHMFIGAAVPVLNPANVQDVLDYGLYGWALSRYSGCWVALKAITDNMDSALSADLRPDRINIRVPADFEMPEGGLNAQWPTTPLEQERLLHKYRIYAARSFAYVNHLNQVTLDTPNPRLGIMTTGKSHLDVLEALRDLGIDRETASRVGLRIFKVGMSWPLEPKATHEFARGLKEILVVEEKRSILEDQITGQLYNWPVAERPRVVGEFDEKGQDLVSNLSELTPGMVARAIGSRITRFYDSPAIRERLAFLDAKEVRLKTAPSPLTRTPYFCSGCPHNTSTRVPEGSIGHAGIGCHYMVRWMDRQTELFTQMGGEGASWIGQAPFTDTPHTFQNIGDGTYFHSGILALRAAVASGVNITYRILYNDAVAMTGGQPVDGQLTLEQLVSQVRAEGVERIAVVAEHLDQARSQLSGMEGITLHAKKDYDQLLRDIREVPGTSVIVFDQTCASEKRRRRKRGLMPASDTRVFINSAVCEGCGDCSTQSNCLSVIPRESELGRKRQIDQNACNQDFSCLDGFCPSFVTVTGARLKKPALQNPTDVQVVLSPPELPDLDRPWNVLVTGIGGTGVLTVSSILAMAAHLEGRGCSTLNQTGLAQKFGAVVSHVKIAATQDSIHAVRVPTGDADLLLGGDLVVAAGTESLAKLHPDRSRAVVNSHMTPTADFIRHRDHVFPAGELCEAITRETGPDGTEFVDATDLARRLLGDPIGANLFLLGYAWQRGLVPVSQAAIERAIDLNGVSVGMNRDAFVWGRRAAVNLAAVDNLAGRDQPSDTPLTDPEAIIQWRFDWLERYQDRRWAERYLELVNAVRQAEPEGGAGELTVAVAKNLFHLMSYKDEYEVARLFTDGTFRQQLEAQFEGDYQVHFHMAPPWLSRRHPQTGVLEKRRLPGWTMAGFRLLAKLKWLRGRRLDPFGYSEERQLERTLIKEYREVIQSLLPHIDPTTYDRAVTIAALPRSIRGFGHVKLAAIRSYQKRLADQVRRYREPALQVLVRTP